jgi:exodeoxyribonuclease V alpha subunit
MATLFDRKNNGDEVTAEGEVARITYENPETGFRVVRLAQPGLLERLTVVGIMPQVTVGARVRVRGYRIVDTKHGEQIRVQSLTELAPDTLVGMERYLASGSVSGVGPKFAARIVETFGLQTMQVLEEQPHRLHEVAGLGARKIDRIVESWNSQRAVRDVMVFLQAHGASAGLAMRIFKRYGQDAVRLIQEDPYRLSMDVWGVGFRTADKLAQSLGIEATSAARVRAGLVQALRDASEAGHVFLEQQELFERSAALLAVRENETVELTETEFTPALAALVASLHVVTESMPQSLPESKSAIAVYHADLYAAEVRASTNCSELSGRKLLQLETYAAAVADFEQSANVTLAVSQRRAIEVACSSPLAVITGGPGVGKTTIVRAVLFAFRKAKLSVRLAAPTGRAAKRLSETTGQEATTLHRLLEFEPRTMSFKRNEDAPLEGDLLVVDECSMVDIMMMDALLRAIGKGMRVLLVGDVDQLASVGPGAVLRDILASTSVPQVRLSEIFRQKRASLIVLNAHRINAGEMPEVDMSVDEGADFFIVERKDPERAQDTIVELVRDRIPKRFGLDSIHDVQVLTPMHRGAAGSLLLNQRLQAECNPQRAGSVELKRGERLFRLGDKVMQLRNDYDRNVFNGDVGIVTEIDAEAATLKVRFDEERTITYEAANVDELVLAYACSIHKSQGSEYPAVVIPLLTAHFVMLSRNLLYTAVTRARRLCVLVADPRAVRMALDRMTGDERKSGLAERLARAPRVMA